MIDRGIKQTIKLFCGKIKSGRDYTVCRYEHCRHTKIQSSLDTFYVHMKFTSGCHTRSGSASLCLTCFISLRETEQGSGKGKRQQKDKESCFFLVSLCDQPIGIWNSAELAAGRCSRPNAGKKKGVGRGRGASQLLSAVDCSQHH